MSTNSPSNTLHLTRLPMPGPGVVLILHPNGIVPELELWEGSELEPTTLEKVKASDWGKPTVIDTRALALQTGKVYIVLWPTGREGRPLWCDPRQHVDVIVEVAYAVPQFTVTKMRRSDTQSATRMLRGEVD